MIMGDQFLSIFNNRVHELFDSTAFGAYHMIVVFALVELEDALIAFEVVTLDKSRRFELCQNTINSGESNVLPCLQKAAVDIFGGHMLMPILVQDLKYLRSR